jgi:hypothetical protein
MLLLWHQKMITLIKMAKATLCMLHPNAKDVIGKLIAKNSDAAETNPVAWKMTSQSNMPIIAVPGIKAEIPPIVTETPFPPLNLKNIGKSCPKTTPNIMAMAKSALETPPMGCNLKTNATAANDLKKSPRNAKIPAFLPMVRTTFVAPEFPLPTLLISIPQKCDTTRANNTDPIRYPTRAKTSITFKFI